MSTDEEDDRQVLDQMFAAWVNSITSEERFAIDRWQSRDRTYELVNRLLRGREDSNSLSEEQTDLVAVVIDGLESAIAKGLVTQDLTLFRGVRNLAGTFGYEDGGLLVGQRFRLKGFMSLSVDRSVAEAEFTSDPRGATLRVLVPAGVNAAWIAGVGDPLQGELLLGHLTGLLIRACNMFETPVLLDCEVVA
jgi:ADP-ribosyltransferase exoenzyme